MERKTTLPLTKLNLEEQNGGSNENGASTFHAGSNQVPPENRLFNIQGLPLKIFRYLTVKDLKIARLICSKFNNIVLDMLGVPSPLRGNFYRDDRTTPKVCYFNIKHEHQTLERQLPDLIAVIKSSSLFPIRHFRFHRGCIKDPLLQEFFSLYGFRIKSLYLDVHFPERVQSAETYATLEQLFIILKAIPNAEYLELDYFPQTQTWAEGNVPENINNKYKWSDGTNRKHHLTYSRLLLPNLRILKLGHVIPDWLFLTLVESTPKLKEVRTKWGGRENYFTTFNKLHLLKSLHLIDMLKLETEYQIISAHPNVHLSKMRVHTRGFSFLPSVGPLLSRLFHSNQNTLKSLQLCALGDISQLQIPELPKVLKLEVVNLDFGLMTAKLFPPNVDMGKIFPNLKSLIVNIARARIQDPLPLFAPALQHFAKCPSPLPTVQSLTFVCDKLLFYGGSEEMYPLAFMEFFAKLCPRVTSAEFRGIKGLTQESGDIWTFFRKLTHLKFSFNMSNNMHWNSIHNTLHSIDSFFTGIPGDNLKDASTWKMYGNWNREQLKRIEKVRKYPSILLLKELKRLEIIVYNQEGLEDRGSFLPTLTDASKYFGFDFCHHLHVSLSFHLQIRSHLSKWKEVTKSLLTKPCLQRSEYGIGIDYTYRFDCKKMN